MKIIIKQSVVYEWLSVWYIFDKIQDPKIFMPPLVCPVGIGVPRIWERMNETTKYVRLIGERRSVSLFYKLLYQSVIPSGFYITSIRSYT